MLVLSMKPQSHVLIKLPTGEEIKIVFVGCRAKDKSVSIGVDAPRSIPVMREELLPNDHPMKSGNGG